MKSIGIGCLILFLFVPQAIGDDNASKPASQAEKPPLTDEELAAIVAKYAEGGAQAKKSRGTPACAFDALGRVERILILAQLKGGDEFKVLFERDGFNPQRWVNLPASRVLRENQVFMAKGKVWRCAPQSNNLPFADASSAPPQPSRPRQQ